MFVIASGGSRVRTRRAYAAPLASEQTRPAFTLIEMLVVIAIIAILAAMVAVGTIKVIASQRGSNTQNAMRTIQKVLNEHWEDVVSKAKKETGIEGSYAAIDSVFGADSTGGERNRIIWIKMRLMEAFPITYAEIQKPYPYTSGIIPANMRRHNGTYLKTIGSKTADSAGGTTESSACLYMALSISRNGTALNLDNLGSATVADTDGDGMLEYIDAWGKPLTFYRFPTNNQALQDTDPNPSSPYADPTDPQGFLFNWKKGKGRTTFRNSVHPIASPFNAAAAAYVRPTIVSSGPDGFLSLDKNMGIIPTPPPANPSNQDADNIYSFQLR